MSGIMCTEAGHYRKMIPGRVMRDHPEGVYLAIMTSVLNIILLIT